MVKKQKQKQEMTAEEFLEEHGIPNMPTQYSPQFQTDVNDTAKALEAYHQAKLKLLSIADVVERRELLVDFAMKRNNAPDFVRSQYERDADEYLSKIN